LKIEGLKIPSSKQSSSTSAKPGVIPSYAAAPAMKPAVQAAPVKPRINEDERRRTQRVLLRVRASIHVALQGKATTLDVATVSVSPQGALVVLNQSLPSETHLILEHGATREQIACKVTRTPRQMPEGFHTPLEFDSPAPDFWKIAFPPSDWRSDDQ
jgi:hypothetical protein